VIKSLKE